MTRKSLRSAFARRFARAKRGAVAVEFAFVAIPFLLLLFGIVELALVFTATTTLEQATESAARKVRTGEFQTTTAGTKQAFRESICARMSWLSTQCSTNLYIDVRTFSSFGTVSSTPLYDPNLFTTHQTCWAASQASDIVLVRSYMEWRLLTPLMNAALVNMGAGTGKRMLTAAAAFRNEPYNNSTPLGASCTLGGQNG